MQILLVKALFSRRVRLSTGFSNKFCLEIAKLEFLEFFVKLKGDLRSLAESKQTFTNFSSYVILIHLLTKFLSKTCWNTLQTCTFIFKVKIKIFGTPCRGAYEKNAMLAKNACKFSSSSKIYRVIQCQVRSASPFLQSNIKLLLINPILLLAQNFNLQIVELEMMRGSERLQTVNKPYFRYFGLRII